MDYPNLDDTDQVELELGSQTSAITHISSLKTPQTQRISDDLSEVTILFLLIHSGLYLFHGHLSMLGVSWYIQSK